MRKLLNTLYITSEDYYLGLDGETVVIYKDSKKVAQFPLHTLESIITFSYKGASPSLMGRCARAGINLCFLSRNGKFLARTCGEDRGNVLLRKEQYRISDDESRSNLIAQNFIAGKAFNSRWSIERTIRDHKLRIDEEKLKKVSIRIKDSIMLIRNSSSLDELRGIEGETAKMYFSVYNDLVLNQKDNFVFCGRSKRPPLDNVNAMLSFGYTLLANNCASALESVGLDSYVGFLHRDRPGRRSLSLDIMEELRPVLVDRFVLKLINTKMIKEEYFIKQESGAVLMTDEGRKIFLNAFQERKKEKIEHPYLKEVITWGLVPYVQALLLARYIRGDLDEYPPFLWK